MDLNKMIDDGVKWYAEATEARGARFYKQTRNTTLWSFCEPMVSDEWVSIQQNPVEFHKELISIYDYRQNIVTKIAPPEGAEWYAPTNNEWYVSGWYKKDRHGWHVWREENVSGEWVLMGHEEAADKCRPDLIPVEHVPLKDGELPPINYVCEALIGSDVVGFRLLFKGPEAFSAEIINLETQEEKEQAFVWDSVRDSIRFFHKGAYEERKNFINHFLAYYQLRAGKDLDMPTIIELYNKGLLKGQ